MITKKKPEFNLEKNRVIYLQLGLFITSAGLLMAFTWRSPVYLAERHYVERTSEVTIEEIMVEEDQEIPEVETIQKQEIQKPNETLLSEKIEEKENEDKDEGVATEIEPIDIFTIGDPEPPIGKRPELDKAYKYVDKEAEFLGNWQQYLIESMVYPEISIKWGDEGTVWVQFIVEKDGSISNVTVHERTAKSKKLRKEAIRVIKASPTWQPGELKAERVRTKVITPIRFHLR